MAKLFLGTREITSSIHNSKYGVKREENSGVLTQPSEFINLSGIMIIGEYALSGAYCMATNLENTDIAEFKNIENILAGGCSYTFYGSNITSIDFNTLKEISGTKACQYMCYGCNDLESINFHNLRYVYASKCFEYFCTDCYNLESVDFTNLLYIQDMGQYSFARCTSLQSVNLSNVILLGDSVYSSSGSYPSLWYMFSGCTNLQSINLNSLIKLEASPGGLFSGCTSLTSISFPSLVSLEVVISSYCEYMFSNCTNLQSVYFSALTLCTTKFSTAFSGCTSLQDIYFSALTAEGIDYIDTFNNMLNGVDGCTLHFPTDMAVATISGLTGYPNFGGTNTTILFDQTRLSVRNIDLHNMTEISIRMPMRRCLYNYKERITVDLHNLRTINGEYIAEEVFYNCRNLENVKLYNLKSISGNRACDSMFNYCQLLDNIDLSSLESISGQYACLAMFGNCINAQSVKLSSLERISGQCACQSMFYNCTSLQDIYFSSLKTTSFEYTDAFTSILYNTNGCTLHFPSNLQSTISGLTGYPNFGGTNTVLVFDLPATA